MKEQLASFGITALQLLSPVFLALIGLVAVKMHALIDARVKNERVKGVLGRLNDTAWTVVSEIQQTMVSKLDPKNPGQGFTEAKSAAMANLKTHLGQKGIDEAKQILGIGDTDLEKVISSFIESAVHNMKRSQPQVLAVGEALKVAGGAA